MIDTNVNSVGLPSDKIQMDVPYLDVSRLEPDEHIYLVDWHNERDYPPWVQVLKERGSTFNG